MQSTQYNGVKVSLSQKEIEFQSTLSLNVNKKFLSELIFLSVFLHIQSKCKYVFDIENARKFAKNIV